MLSLKTSDDLNEQGMKDSMTKLSIATRLAYQIHEREMENYFKSVLRCITCNFDTFLCDFEDQGFRENFFNGVVTSLRADYEMLPGERCERAFSQLEVFSKNFTSIFLQYRFLSIESLRR